MQETTPSLHIFACSFS